MVSDYLCLFCGAASHATHECATRAPIPPPDYAAPAVPLYVVPPAPHLCKIITKRQPQPWNWNWRWVRLAQYYLRLRATR